MIWESCSNLRGLCLEKAMVCCTTSVQAEGPAVHVGPGQLQIWAAKTMQNLLCKVYSNQLNPLHIHWIPLDTTIDINWYSISGRDGIAEAIDHWYPPGVPKLFLNGAPSPWKRLGRTIYFYVQTGSIGHEEGPEWSVFEVGTSILDKNCLDCYSRTQFPGRSFR